jgi:hypothetical protein
MQNILGKLVLMSTVIATTFATNAAMAEKRFEVPFNFTVAGQNWPAGTYVIERNQLTDNVLLQSKDHTKSFGLTLGPGNPSPDDTRAVLTFAEDNQNHELKTVQLASKTGSVRHKNSKQIEQQPVRMVVGQ